jgi:MipA family protein
MIIYIGRLRIMMKYLYILIYILFITSHACANPMSTNDEGSPWRYTLGLIQITVPKYQGASEYRWFIVPNFDISYKKRFFFNAYRGLGVNLIQTNKITAGISTRYNFGGLDERSERFSGLHDVNDQFQSGAFINYKLGLLSFGFSAYRAIGVLHGAGFYQPNIGLFLPFSRKYLMRVSISGRFDDKDYMEGIFGVDEDESEKSRLPEYLPQAGWQSISYSIMPIIRLNKNWSFTLIFSAKQFIDQAAKSPLIDNKTTYFSALSLNYRFN